MLVDPAFVRPPDKVRLLGDSRKARRDLGWEPVVSFEALIAMMVDADIRRLKA